MATGLKPRKNLRAFHKTSRNAGSERPSTQETPGGSVAATNRLGTRDPFSGYSCLKNCRDVTGANRLTRARHSQVIRFDSCRKRVHFGKRRHFRTLKSDDRKPNLAENSLCSL